MTLLVRRTSELTPATTVNAFINIAEEVGARDIDAVNKILTIRMEVRLVIRNSSSETFELMRRRESEFAIRNPEVPRRSGLTTC